MKRPPSLDTGLISWLQRGLFLLLLIFFTPTVQAVQSGSKDASVSAVMDQLYDLSRKIVNKAGRKGSAIAMEAAGETQLLIDQLREVYGEGKSESLLEVNLEEGAVFGKISKTLKKLLKELGGKSEHVGELTQALRDSLDPLFAGSEGPRVLSYLPGYHVIHPKKDKFDVTVTGRHLNYHDSHIALDGKTISPSANKEDKLVFSIPTDIFQPHPFKVTHKELTLTVYKEKRTWYTLGFKKENIPVEYSLVVYSMPRNLAKYSVTIKKMTTGVERKRGKGPIWSIRSGGRQDIRRTFSHAAENGWKFDPGSAEFVVTRPGKEGKTDVSIMMSPDLITVEMLSDGEASQTNPFEGHLTYTEWRSIKSEEEEEIASGKYINWIDRQVLTLPENTVSYVVSIEMFNGLKRSLDGGAYKGDYVKVQYDPPLRQLSLTPQKTATIMGR